MESITPPNRDKKMIVWNFMEELCRKHNEAINDGRQPTFALADFEEINLFEGYVSSAGVIGSNSDSMILDALLEYEQRGYYKIENDLVNLTESGLAECRKPVHDWDSFQITKAFKISRKMQCSKVAVVTKITMIRHSVVE